MYKDGWFVHKVRHNPLKLLQSTQAKITASLLVS